MVPFFNLFLTSLPLQRSSKQHQMVSQRSASYRRNLRHINTVFSSDLEISERFVHLNELFKVVL